MTSAEPTNPTQSDLVARPWWQLGLAAGVAVAVVNVIIYFVYQAVNGAPLQVTPSPGGPLQDLAVFMVVVLSVLPPLIAALLAFALSRWTRSARAWFIAISVVAALLSLASPLSLPQVSLGNKLTLVVMHLVVAAVTIGALVPRLSDGRA